MQPAIHIHNLHKTFRNGSSLKAVDGVSFDVHPGEIFSLLGPNGAGKTTTIAMLSTLLAPDPGEESEISLYGHSLQADARAAKSLLGVVPQEIALYGDLSARENLAFWGRMYGLRGATLNQRVDEVLGLIGLTERAKDRVDKFSGGMKRRVNIGVALLHQPKVIYMDEPTVGIDPQSRRSILDGVLALKAQGTTVLYTTHYMEEAQELSDRIAIMDHGRLIALGTHAELLQNDGQQTRIGLSVDAANESLLEHWRGLPGVSDVRQEGRQATISVADSNHALAGIFAAAAAAGARISAVDIQEPNLESVFLSLTGRALRDSLQEAS